MEAAVAEKFYFKRNLVQKNYKPNVEHVSALGRGVMNYLMML